MNAILGFFATIISYPLKLIYLLVNNYGLSVIILTLLVRACMVPLYAKQIKSQAMMSEIQPRIQEIQRKYARDRELMNEKMQEVYAKYHYNPMSGCLPLLIQMPIIMGLFALLRNPLRYITKDSMIFAFHEPFLWIDDLSQPDPWILPIIAGIATFIAFTMNRMLQDTGSDAANQSAAMMKMMQYIFPLMILWMARSFPSGLALYWAVSQIIQIGFNIHLQTLRKKIKREQKERQIREKLEKKNRNM